MVGRTPSMVEFRHAWCRKSTIDGTGARRAAGGYLSRPMGTGRRTAALLGALLVLALGSPPAFAAFPYTRAGGDPKDFTDLYLNAGETPNDLSGDGNEFKFAATPDPSNTLDNSNPVELGGVRGAHIDDA